MKNTRSVLGCIVVGLFSSSLSYAYFNPPQGRYLCTGQYEDDKTPIRGIITISKSKNGQFYTHSIFKDKYGQSADKGQFTPTDNPHIFIEEWHTYKGRKVTGLTLASFQGRSRINMSTLTIDGSKGFSQPESLVCKLIKK